MDDKKKIVLASEDIITKGLDDIFINVNLQHTFNQIKKDKYDNNFDLAEQFRKERNASRDFRIYGILDSNIIDLDSFSFDVYKDSGLTDFHSTVATTPLIYDEKNVFRKKRGKYLLELNNYDADVAYMKITGDYISYGDQVVEQRVVYYTLDGDFVEYGTQTVDIGLNNPGFLEIENDFPFFYNKHWIKKDIEIVEEKKAIIQFQEAESNVNEGNSVEITVELDKPSPFGNEIVDLDVELVTAKVGDYSVSLSGNPVTFPTTISYATGEQFKTFTFNGLNDDFPEFSESLFINMSNYQLVESGLTTVHAANIHDETPRHYANYNFGELYRNRYVFSGRTYFNSNNPNPVHTNSFSILRNGLKYERRNEEFYPNDTYTLSIENKGGDSVLPINNSLGVSLEELFLSGQVKTYNLSSQYDGTQVQKLNVIFSGSGINVQSSNHGSMFINGVQFNTNNGINYVSAKLAFTSLNPLTLKNLEIPWTFDFDDNNKIITITSKSSGVPVDFSTLETKGPALGPVDPNKIPIVEEVDSFVFYDQIPLEVKLAANSNANNSCLYEIIVNKAGYGGVVIPNSPVPALSSATDNYLITGVDLVMRDWDSNIQNCTFITGTTVATTVANNQTWSIQNVTPNPSNFIMEIGEAYVNGTVLYSSNLLPGKQTNESDYLSAAFYPKKLLTEPCTDDPILNVPIAQRTILTIPGIGSGNGTYQQLLQQNSNSNRSFDFRTGTTGAYTTFSHSNNSFQQFQDWKWGSNVSVNGGTYGGVNSQMSNILDFGNAPVTQFGPIEGQDANGNPAIPGAQTIYLEAKIPGVPFEITNISNASVTTTASNQYNQQVIAGTILGPIGVNTIVPSSLVGGANPARNFLGGFNPALVFVP